MNSDDQPRLKLVSTSAGRPEAWSAQLEDPRIVQALEAYMAALEHGTPPDRQAFLTQHADIAEALAECLDGMDALHVAEPSLHPASGGNAIAGALAEATPGTPLGDFRIIRELGRGGMGVVYEAEQMSLGRRVALKVLPFAAALDSRQLQRFKNEAQAAAHLNHPNIVTVYAVGVERGVHFYAMRLIEGQNLAALVAEMRGADAPASGSWAQLPWAQGVAESLARAAGSQPAGEPRPDTRSDLGARLSTQRSGQDGEFYRTLSRWMVQAAEGLDYAHGVGIVHRDVKPANLLVDHRGNLWITDFGLAQFHIDGGLTRTGDLLGTLRYMSPEQAGGQRVLLDQRTDIYSLGATLYELMTLRPIFDGADQQTLLRQILHDEPALPRSLDQSIPPELETIVLKAVSKSPADRYATAREFADDLQRFLDNQPILARRPTLVQRVRKWGRRHPSVVVAGVALCLLTAAVSILIAWLLNGEQEKTQDAYDLLFLEQRKTKAAYQSERQVAQSERVQGERSEQRFRLARRAVDQMIQMAEEELNDQPHMQGLRRRLLETALEYYQEFIELRRHDPDAQVELAVTRDRVKRILDDLAALQGAGQLYLLSEANVLDDLRVSEDQRKRVTELTKRLDEQRREKFQEFHKLSAEERQRRFIELARTNDAAVSAILTREQLDRLRQIGVQCQGLTAFRDVGVIAELKLKPDQRDRIRVIEMETFFPKPDGPGRPGPGGPGRRINEQTLRAAFEKLDTVLDADQRKKWKEMTGEPLKGGIPFRPPGPPPGPPKGP